MNALPDSIFHDYGAAVVPCLVDGNYHPPAAPGPRYTIVEVGPEAIGALEEHWQTGRPVELLGVVFEFAVIASVKKRFFRTDRILVRGVRAG